MLTTRTGNFPIGFRRGWSDWQKDLNAVLAFAKQNQLGVLDLGTDGDVTARQVTAAGLQVGSVDLKEWGKLMSPDKAVRAEAVATNLAYVKAAVAGGAKNFFCVMLPEKPDRARRDNFKDLVESLHTLAPAMEAAGARMVIEGYPGHGAIVTTPEGYRTLFKEVTSPAVGINYDPSHLIRMHIDPIRFVAEFATRVYHVHGKDTEVFAEALYEFGSEVPATFHQPMGFGAATWRYTIPGHGQMRWTSAFHILKKHNYQGAVSIELEDAHFNGTTDGEKAGLLAGANFLASC